MSEKKNTRWNVAVVLTAIAGFGSLALCEPAWADLTDGLIAHWKLDEVEGPTAYDSAGDNDGTLTNGPQWTSGQIDGALSFDGDNDYVDCGAGEALPAGDSDRTLMAWIKTTATGYRQIVSYGTGATAQAMTLGQNSGRVFVSSWFSPQYSTDDYSINDGKKPVEGRCFALIRWVAESCVSHLSAHHQAERLTDQT